MKPGNLNKDGHLIGIVGSCFSSAPVLNEVQDEPLDVRAIVILICHDLASTAKPSTQLEVGAMMEPYRKEFTE